ncbi:MAG: hypothetical protein OEN01_08770 [Candidatus Krumholzibacteria bacterium]|nr:hypothetical protein [Candidatus Krumholzibacteria bacterium]
MSRYTLTNAFALLVCSTLLFASFGCESVTAPESSEDFFVVDGPNFVRILSTSSSGDYEPMAMSGPVSAMVSASEGGTLTNGRVTLEFPAGALSEDTEITMEMLNDGTLGVELSPHGIQFNAPVVLSMGLEGTTAEGMAASLATYYDNPESGQHEPIPMAAPVDANTTRALIDHFSKYRDGSNG